MNFLEAQEIIAKIKYKRAEFWLSTKVSTNEVVLTVSIPVPCVRTGKVTRVSERLPVAIEHMNVKALINHAYARCKELECHEVSEWFEYDGQRLFNPHAKDPDHKPIAKLPKFPRYEIEVERKPKQEFKHLESLQMGIRAAEEVDSPSMLMRLFTNIWK